MEFAVNWSQRLVGILKKVGNQRKKTPANTQEYIPTRDIGFSI